MLPPHDDRMPLAKAYQRATRVATIAVGMVAPGLVGYLIDRRLGTRAVFTICGFGVGMSFGIWELYRVARQSPGTPPKGPSDQP